MTANLKSQFDLEAYLVHARTENVHLEFGTNCCVARATLINSQENKQCCQIHEDMIRH